MKQNMASPATMAYLVGNYGSQQVVLGCSEEGGWRRVLSSGGETGKQAAALGRGAARRCIAGMAARSR